MVELLSAIENTLVRAYAAETEDHACALRGRRDADRPFSRVGTCKWRYR